jgi:hypothetical protein
MDSTADSSETSQDFIPKATPKRKSEALPKTHVEAMAAETNAKPPKKAQTDKQKEATKKMLAGLKARREQTKKAQDEEEEMLKAEGNELKIQEKQRERLEKAKLARKRLPPVSDRAPYITAAELQKFKLEMMDMVGRPTKVVMEKEVEVERIVEKPVIVKQIVEKPTTKVISGNALLDAIFFK